MQQINLYQDIALEKKIAAPTLWYGSSFALLAVLAIVYGVIQVREVQQLEKTLQAKQAELDSVTSALSLLQQQFPKRELDPLLISDIERLSNISRSLKSVVALLADKDSDRNRGFSHYFKALGEQSIASVWLTEINIDAELAHIRLQGSTYEPSQLPVFIKRLNKEASFTGQYFAHIHMQASESDVEQIDFTVSTSSPESEEPASL